MIGFAVEINHQHSLRNEYLKSAKDIIPIAAQRKLKTNNVCFCVANMASFNPSCGHWSYCCSSCPTGHWGNNNITTVEFSQEKTPIQEHRDSVTRFLLVFYLFRYELNFNMIALSYKYYQRVLMYAQNLGTLSFS